MRQDQSPVPPPIFMPQQTAVLVAESEPATPRSTSTASASAIPRRPAESSNASETPSASPLKPAAYPKPKLRLEVRDLRHAGATQLLEAINAGCALDEAVDGVLRALYTVDARIPGTRSVTVIARAMPGVAYTTGTELDDEHKEIHLSLDYVRGIDGRRRAEEILGVLRHEMVHCFQWNAWGSAPGGLIEGIADWVRLRAGMAPPHWIRTADGDWDAGYQHTAYFLDYLDDRFGQGTVMRINERLRAGKYHEHDFWTGLFGAEVGRLWHSYGRWLKEKRDEEDLVVVAVGEQADDASAAGPDHVSTAPR